MRITNTTFDSWYASLCAARGLPSDPLPPGHPTRAAWMMGIVVGKKMAAQLLKDDTSHLPADCPTRVVAVRLAELVIAGKIRKRRPRSEPDARE